MHGRPDFSTLKSRTQRCRFAQADWGPFAAKAHALPRNKLTADRTGAAAKALYFNAFRNTHWRHPHLL